MDKEERIRRRAYEIWERAGHPQGKEAQHWEQARHEIEDEGVEKLGPMPGTEGASTAHQTEPAAEGEDPYTAAGNSSSRGRPGGRPGRTSR